MLRIGGRNNSKDPSAPAIPRPQVRIPSTPSMLFQDQKVIELDKMIHLLSIMFAKILKVICNTSRVYLVFWQHFQPQTCNAIGQIIIS